MWLLSHSSDPARERTESSAETEQTHVFSFITPTIGLIHLHRIRDLITMGGRMETGCRWRWWRGGKGILQDLMTTRKVTDPSYCGLKVKILHKSPHKSYLRHFQLLFHLESEKKTPLLLRKREEHLISTLNLHIFHYFLWPSKTSKQISNVKIVSEIRIWFSWGIKWLRAAVPWATPQLHMTAVSKRKQSTCSLSFSGCTFKMIVSLHKHVAWCNTRTTISFHIVQEEKWSQ